MIYLWHLRLKSAVKVVIILTFVNYLCLLRQTNCSFVKITIYLFLMFVFVYNDMMFIQKELHGFNNVWGIIKLVMLHAISQKQMSTALFKTLKKNLNWVLIGHHRIRYSVEYCTGTYYFTNNLKVVESFLNQQVNNAPIFFSCNIFYWFYRGDEQKTSWLVDTC